MAELEKNPISQGARQQMGPLDEAGWEAYKDQQLLRAAEIYGQGLEIAEAIADTNRIVHFRFWQGVALLGGGRLRQALAVLTPILQDCKPSDNVEAVYTTLTRYIEIAQELPVSLGAIEKAYEQTESFLRDSGHIEWRHRILCVRARLYYLCGMYREALRAAQESWALWRDDDISLSPETHLDSLVNISLRLRDAEQAQRYLAEWQVRDNKLPKVREPIFCSRQSGLARLIGRVSDAVDWARRAVISAEQVDNHEHHYLIVCMLMQAFLYTGDSERAQDSLGRLVVMRHSENGHERYGVHLLRGDYHLAVARQAAGMAPADDEYGLEFPPPDGIADTKVTYRELVRARRAYDTALKVGRWIDERLQCTSKQQEIAKRYARIDSIERRLAPR